MTSSSKLISYSMPLSACSHTRIIIDKQQFTHFHFCYTSFSFSCRMKNDLFDDFTVIIVFIIEFKYCKPNSSSLSSNIETTNQIKSNQNKKIQIQKRTTILLFSSVFFTFPYQRQIVSMVR